MANLQSTLKTLEALQDKVYSRLPRKLTDQQQEHKLLMENSFYEFVKGAWPVIEGGREFIPGWHIEAIAAHLEALKRLEIKDLLINIPFRTGKSNLVSVLYSAWVWTTEPYMRFLYISFAQGLCSRDSVRCRRLIQSDWYQKYWGDKYWLMSDMNNKLRFDNSCQGYRIASSIGGSNTGEGGEFQICLSYDTMIQTDQGNIPIGKIVEENIFCKILSFNHEENISEFKEIEAYEKNSGHMLLEIELEDGNIIKCTEEHPVYVEGKGYILAKDLSQDDIVLTL
jgi:hypothetical protein